MGSQFFTENGTFTWRETIQSRSEGGVPLMGSFRGARFVVPGSEALVGRRVEVHEYPLRDVPWAEDLGRAARRFTVEVFVDGRLQGGYLAARDALIAALEEPGSGTLVHPWYGTMRVSLAEPASVRESTREGGRAACRLVFVEAGELRFPTAAADTAWAVDQRAGAPGLPTPDGQAIIPGSGGGALAAIMADFSRVFDVSRLPAWTLLDVQRDLALTLAQVERQVAGVTGRVAAEIRAPGNMAAAIVGSLRRLADIAGEPARAVTMYRRLFSAGDCCPPIAANTTARRQQATSTAALIRVVRQTAVVEAVRSASRAVPARGAYQGRDAVLALADEMQAAIGRRLEDADPVTAAPLADETFQALATLRAAVATDLRGRGAMLPELTTYRPAATLPALVVAHRLYGTAGRADEITGRNRIRHPGFVPGGEELEVLRG